MKILMHSNGGFIMHGCAIRRTLSILAWFAVSALGCFSAAAQAQDVIRDVIHGSAQNLSRNQPAVGDEVSLIRIDIPRDARDKAPPSHVLGPETHEEIEARTKTDSQGSFTFHVQHSGEPYFVRVVHQGVSYEQQASPGDNLSMQVFDAASRLSAISGSIEILRVGTRAAGNEKFLHVSDMYEIRNDSRPPMTQAGAHTFDVYLPANAKIDSVLAAAPSGAVQGQHQERIGVVISATPVPGEPGHYAVDFPLLPGATKFAFNYDLPYEGRARFQTRHEYGFQQMAVMIPPTMKFSSPSSAFQKLATGNNEYQVEAAIQLKAGNGPAFEISGSGPLPALQSKAGVQPQSAGFVNSNASDSTTSVPALPAPPTNSVPKLEDASRSWAWLALTAGVLLLCALLVLRVHNARLVPALLLPSRTTRARSVNPANGAADFLEAPGFLEGLKEELFQLETDRIRGSISTEEYACARQALEETFKRVLLRPTPEEADTVKAHAPIQGHAA